MFKIFLSRTFVVSFATTIIGYLIVKPFVDSMYLSLAIATFSGIMFGMGSIINEMNKKGRKPRINEMNKKGRKPRMPKSQPTTKGDIQC